MFKNNPNSFIEKVKLVLPSYLIIQFSTIAFLLLLRWLLCIRFPVLQLDDSAWFFIPFFFPWIPILIWRKFLPAPAHFKKRKDLVQWFSVITWFSTTSLFLISQHAIDKMSGKYVTISTIEEIDFEHPEHFYNIKTIPPDTFEYKAHVEFRSSGKHNQHLDINLYFVAPLYNNNTRNSKGQCWYGIKLSKQISNNLSDEEKDKLYRDFWYYCQETQLTKSYDSLLYFERSYLSSDHKNFLKAIDSGNNENTIVLMPVFEPYDASIRTFFIWLGVVWLAGLIAITTVLHRSRLLREKSARSNSEEDDVFDFLGALIPRGNHIAVSLIVNINILVFIIMILSGLPVQSSSGKELLEWGGLRQAEVLEGEWWRLLSSLFVHATLAHLIGNLVCLGFSHIFMTDIINQIKFTIVYFVSGLAGGLAGLIWHPEIVSVGASGAIFGLFGYLVATYILDKRSRKDLSFGFYFTLVTIGITTLIGAFSKSTDNTAHYAGLLTGAILCILYLCLNKKISWYWFISMVILVIASLGILRYVAWRKENPSYEFELARSIDISVTCENGLGGMNLICGETFQGYDPGSIYDEPVPLTGYASKFSLNKETLTREEVQIALANGDSSFLCVDCFNISNRIKVDYSIGESNPRWVTIFGADQKPIVSVEYKNVRGFFLLDCPELKGKLE